MENDVDRTDVESLNDEENILYDLTINAEWPQEPELCSRITKDRQSSYISRLQTAYERALWTSLRILRIPIKSSTPCILPTALIRLVNSQLNWHIAVSSGGNLVAVLQDQSIEIRSKRDDFGSVVGRGTVPADPHPQWRCISWSRDEAMVVSSTSGGVVSLFDMFGSELCVIHPPQERTIHANAPVDLSSAIAALIYTDFTPTTEWSHRLVVINYHGTLTCYDLHRERGYQPRHTFHFSYYYPLGVSSVVYHPRHRLFYVGGVGTARDTRPAAREGLSCWRPIDTYPFYKLAASLNADDKRVLNKTLPFYRRWRNITFKPWKKEHQDGVFKLSLSPDGRCLVSIHHSGALCVWDAPSLRCRHVWPLHQQPGHDELSPDTMEKPQQMKMGKDATSKLLIDVNWWSHTAIILSRCNGAVTVSSAASISNLLGSSPEWFEPSPQVTLAHGGGFLGLECEAKYPSLKRRLIAADADDDENRDDSDDGDERSMLQRGSQFVNSALFYATDNERFMPPRKRPRMVSRTYRMVCLKSTTPEQLYARKIDSEEYGEALVLAQAYGLDCDLVYQRQWRKSDVSLASIQDYLSKISKRSWVLHECLERVPEDMDAMRELLEYGLRGTDLHALITIGRRGDGGRFILCDDEEYEDFEIDQFDEEARRLREEEKKARRDDLLAQIDFPSLNLDQRELCRARHKLLTYLRRLYTYEIILGGKQAAEELFDHKFYGKFRSRNIVKIAVDYTRASDWRAVEVLFTYHGADLLPHRLAILANFPETTSVYDFRSLLPEVRQDKGVMEEWEEDVHMEEDWSDLDQCRLIVEPATVDLGAFLYDDMTNYDKFRGLCLPMGVLCEWYERRALDIEKFSRQVDHALELVVLGQERGVQGLSQLRDELVTMETLVYECHGDDSLTFTQFRSLSDLEKINLLMSKSPAELYIKNLHRWVLPFVQRCEGVTEGAYDSLLHQYVVAESKEDLTLSVLVFETSKTTQPIISDPRQLLTTALDALYTTTRDDQLNLCVRISDCLTPHTKRDVSVKLQKQVGDLKKHLHAAKVLLKNDIKLTLNTIKNTQLSTEETKDLFVKLTRVAARRSPPMVEADWWKLLDDLEDLQRQCFKAISHDLCLQIFMESLLCSGNVVNIKLAGQLMDKDDSALPSPNRLRSFVTPRRTRLPRDKGVALIVSAAMEYFDSSANLLDPCMDLARACLNLPHEPTESIREELDLISSLSLLHDFGVNVLPLQVRLCKDRLDMVKKAVSQRPNTYKQSEKLLRLGHLVRVPGETQIDRDGQVLHLVAEAAINAGDYVFANDVCQQLMGDNYDPIWVVCRNLAEHEDFRNIKAKFELLSFSVTYCDSEMIEPILKATCLLELQILCEAVSKTLPENNTTSTSSSKSREFSATSALKQTRQILATTTKTTKDILVSTRDTTKAVLATVTDAKWWQDTISSLKRPAGVARSSTIDAGDGNVKFEKQGCHPFYSSALKDTYVDYAQDFDLDHTATDLPVNLLRAAKLEELVTEGGKTNQSTQVFLELSKKTFNKDTALGLAYTLPIRDLNEVDAIFDSLPKTAVTVQLITYYYALQIHQRLATGSQTSPSRLFVRDPSAIIDQVMDHVDKTETDDWSDEVRWLTKKMREYKSLYDDIYWVEILHDLGIDVDVSRFIKDHEYKAETILGLALCVDDAVFSTAVSLTRRYEVCTWELYMSHAEYVFCDSGLSAPEIESRVSSLKLTETLTQNSSQFMERMYTYVLPTIAGTNYALLIYFYGLLGECGAPTRELTPNLHVQLLKRIKSITTDLDYKSLIDTPSHPIRMIAPVLTPSNVNQFAKLTTKIPVQGVVGGMTPSCVYCVWTARLFWEGLDPGQPQPTEMAGWVQRYESCLDNLHRLSPLSIVSFAEDIVFTEASREMLSLETRLTLLNRLSKYCSKQPKKKKSQTTDPASEWKDTKLSLDRYSKHLESVKSPVIGELIASEKEELQSYAALFDLSRGDNRKLKELLVRIAGDGNSPGLLNDLISLVIDPVWTPRSIIRDTVSASVASCREGSEMLGSPHSPRGMLETLDNVLTAVSEHVTGGGSLVRGDDLMPLLRSFCSDDSVAIQPRLDTLELMEKNLALSDADLGLLMLYRTNAVVSHAWPHLQLCEEDVNNNAGRLLLFNDLLTKCDSFSPFSSLIRLLQIWPPLQGLTDSPKDNCWLRTFRSLIELRVPDCRSLVVSTLSQIDAALLMDAQCTANLTDLLISHDQILEAVKVFLLSSHESLYADVESLVPSLSQENLENTELLDLILRQRVTSRVAKTLLFPRVIVYLLANQDPHDSARDYLSPVIVARELKTAGYESEAGWLLLKCRPTHALLRTFSSARSAVAKWLQKH